MLKRGVLYCRVAAGVSARQCHVAAWFCDHSDHSDHSVTILHVVARTAEYYVPVGWNLYCPSHPCPQALAGVSLKQLLARPTTRHATLVIPSYDVSAASGALVSTSLAPMGDGMWPPSSRIAGYPRIRT